MPHPETWERLERKRGGDKRVVACSQSSSQGQPGSENKIKLKEVRKESTNDNCSDPTGTALYCQICII